MMFNNNPSHGSKRKRGAKLSMSDLDLGHLFDLTHCGNQTCNYLSILLLPGVVATIVSYLVFLKEAEVPAGFDLVGLDTLSHLISWF